MRVVNPPAYMLGQDKIHRVSVSFASNASEYACFLFAYFALRRIVVSIQSSAAASIGVRRGRGGVSIAPTDVPSRIDGAHAAGRIRHTNIVNTIYGSGNTDG